MMYNRSLPGSVFDESMQLLQHPILAPIRVQFGRIGTAKGQLARYCFGYFFPIRLTTVLLQTALEEHFNFGWNRLCCLLGRFFIAGRFPLIPADYFHSIRGNERLSAITGFVTHCCSLSIGTVGCDGPVGELVLAPAKGYRHGVEAVPVTTKAQFAQIFYEN